MLTTKLILEQERPFRYVIPLGTPDPKEVNMPRKPAPPAPSYRCNGSHVNPDGQEVQCDNMVKARKPSATGTHWCPEPACQAAKQRYFRGRQRATLDAVRSGASSDEVVELVKALIVNQRSDCATCGLENALVGWVHRSAPGAGAPCWALGHRGPALPPGLLDVVYPERAPQRLAPPPIP